MIAPSGFISDHLELPDDLDIEAKGIAEKQGLAFNRADSLNTDPRFIDARAAAVRSAAFRVS